MAIDGAECFPDGMTVTEDADYLVVGAGALGMAFADALVGHSDASVTLIDRREAPGGHWRDAYPFVRLHQASQFYGVASTVLGDGSLQRSGPEKGLHERARGDQVCAYYGEVLASLAGDGVDFHGRCDYIGDGRFTELDTGRVHAMRPGCRVVDARYLSPSIPATAPPPFDVDPRASVVPAGELPREHDAGRAVVVVGSGKTATDSIVWLLEQGHDPDRVSWIRPRDPWMYNRAVVQPDPEVILRLGADTMTAASLATSPDDLFLRLEDAGIMLRIDPHVVPTMAKTPTLAVWEVELLRQIGDVVRLGHLRRVSPGLLELDRGAIGVDPDALVVHCAVDGVPRPGLKPIWGGEAITLQPVRTGFPCFGAALIGYVEATRPDDDTAKNALCASTPYSDGVRDWIEAAVLGARASSTFLKEKDIREWADTVALNPARTPQPSAEVDELRARLRRDKPEGTARLERLAGMAA